MNTGVPQQNEEVHQGNMDESTNEKIIDDTGGSSHNQQPARSTSAFERIQDYVNANNPYGNVTDKWAPRLDLHNETSESSAESEEESYEIYDEIFKFYDTFHENKNVDVTEESLKAKTDPVLKTEITSQTPTATCSVSSSDNTFSNASVSSIDTISLAQDLYSQFRTLVLSSSIENCLNLNSKHKEPETSWDNRKSNKRVQISEESTSKKNLRAVDFSLLNPRPALRKKCLCEHKADSHVCTKDFTDAVKAKTSENMQSDYKEKNSISESSKERFKNDKRGNKDPEPASKTLLKRRCESQSEVPSVKYRRRCLSITEMENTGTSRQRVRCSSTNVRKCSVDEGIGQSAGSMDDINTLPSRKRKVDKGLETSIKGLSFNTKRLKQNESAFREMRLKDDSDTSNEDSD